MLVCFLMRERKKGCGLEFVGKWGGAGRGENVIRISCMKENLFSIKNKKIKKTNEPI